MARKTYSPQFKFQVVLESLTSDRTDTESARAYDIHPDRRVERTPRDDRRSA